MQRRIIRTETSRILKYSIFPKKYKNDTVKMKDKTL